MAHKSIKILICLAFAFSVAAYFSYTISAERERSAYFQDQEERRAKNDIVFSGPYCYPDKHPDFLLAISFLTASTVASIYFSRLPYLPAALSLAAFSMFPYWFYETKNAISQAENAQMEGLDSLIYHGGPFDVMVFVLLSIVAVWQTWTLLLFLVSPFRRKSSLP